jgi:hypothetical protein
MMSSAFQKFRCALDRHLPDRHAVTWDGMNYVGTCSSCKARIRRHARGKWCVDQTGSP